MANLEIWQLVLLLVVLVGFGCAIWGIFIERQLFTVHEEDQTIAVLQKGAEPIRVLHISDFHFAPWQNRKQKFVKKLANLDVDLVIDTGDNLGHRNAVPYTLEALQGLLKKPGAFVNGSNDYFVPTPRNPFTYLIKPTDRHSAERLPTEELLTGFENAGWLNVNNATQSLKIKNSVLRFVGVDDRHEHLADLKSVAVNAAKAKSGEVLIGITHAPYLDVIDAFLEADVPMLFAGHTHGGQVCIPGFGALVTNCDLPRSAAKGLSVWPKNKKQLWLNVCAGLGHSIFAPVRFACRPEVRVLKLVAKD
ncbi:MAG: metallophosphoesterase [Micrococcales bacterium]